MTEPKEDSGNGVLIVYFAYGENAPLSDGVDASTSASIQLRRTVPSPEIPDLWRI